MPQWKPRDMPVSMIILFLVCPLAALFLIIRLICAQFSPNVSEKIRMHPIIHSVWGCFALVGLIGITGNLPRWPPAFIERRAQRQKFWRESSQLAAGQRFRKIAMPSWKDAET